MHWRQLSACLDLLEKKCRWNADEAQESEQPKVINKQFGFTHDSSQLRPTIFAVKTLRVLSSVVGNCGNLLEFRKRTGFQHSPGA
jgi:hypothetical protein